jgi:hypothetical protein
MSCLPPLPLPLKRAGQMLNERSAMTVMLPLDVWSRIVFAAQESEDWKLRTLIEQAVHEARPPASPFIAPSPETSER